MAGSSKKPSASIPITTHKHADKRPNIPTEELRDFVADEEKSPSKALYPRDPSLDPQLVWKGKDEQDGEDLTVEVVPVYIQEKIHPQAIVENLRAQDKRDDPDPQTALFFDEFDSLPFEDLVDFYRHEQNWSNRMILGDSLLVMTSLAEKEGLKGKVQMIYLDPPYGIKFGSNWQVSTRKRDVKDGSAEDATRQPEQVKAFRDTWELGIHSYLRYLRDRLVVARELLTETGSVFVQIGDENVHLVRCLLDEVFGSENCVCTITFAKTTNLGGQYLDDSSDHLLFYAKNKNEVKFRRLYESKIVGETGARQYRYLMLEDGSWRELSQEELTKPDLVADAGKIFSHDNLTSQTGSETTVFELSIGNKVIKAPQKWAGKPTKKE
jgi:adenine-specific DNA-methyltransferase